MALSRKTQKDVGKYQAKLVGPFTLRQTVYVGIASVLAMLIWNIAGANGADMETKLFIVIMLSGPIALLGFLNPYGMTCLEFVKQYYEYHILSSKVRIYQTVTDDENMEIPEEKDVQAGIDEQQKKEKNKGKKKKGKEEMHQTLADFPEFL